MNSCIKNYFILLVFALLTQAANSAVIRADFTGIVDDSSHDFNGAMFTGSYLYNEDNLTGDWLSVNWSIGNGFDVEMSGHSIFNPSAATSDRLRFREGSLNSLSIGDRGIYAVDESGTTTELSGRLSLGILDWDKIIQGSTVFDWTNTKYGEFSLIDGEWIDHEWDGEFYLGFGSTNIMGKLISVKSYVVTEPQSLGLFFILLFATLVRSKLRSLFRVDKKPRY